MGTSAAVPRRRTGQGTKRWLLAAEETSQTNPPLNIAVGPHKGRLFKLVIYYGLKAHSRVVEELARADAVARGTHLRTQQLLVKGQVSAAQRAERRGGRGSRRQMSRSAGRQVGGQASRWAGKQATGQADGQAGRKAGRQAGRPAGKQARRREGDK